MNGYKLIDSGDGRKWEQFGDFILSRPSPSAIWRSKRDVVSDATFSREEENRWVFHHKLPASWVIEMEGVLLKVAPTEFGHVGVFPEHAIAWRWMQERIVAGSKILNLFAYSGGATLAAAQKGASVCHVDASKGMVQWARENAALNRLTSAPIRWIVDDALKFLRREIKRNSRYDGIILDPPTFGRGSKGEVFKIEKEIQPLIESCKALLSEHPKFFILSCHTPGFTPTVLSHLLGQFFSCPIDAYEMVLESKEALSIPCGAMAKIGL
ncbi:MAG TPA: class I SAM-dependent methyltransferase [Chlamydiales bacterium]|nr:class I SAM-dependent methyltransferase [Chlamydiales bacterium]